MQRVNRQTVLWTLSSYLSYSSVFVLFHRPYPSSILSPRMLFHCVLHHRLFVHARRSLDTWMTARTRLQHKMTSWKHAIYHVICCRLSVHAQRSLDMWMAPMTHLQHKMTQWKCNFIVCSVTGQVGGWQRYNILIENVMSLHAQSRAIRASSNTTRHIDDNDDPPATHNDLVNTCCVTACCHRPSSHTQTSLCIVNFTASYCSDKETGQCLWCRRQHNINFCQVQFILLNLN